MHLKQVIWDLNPETFNHTDYIHFLRKLFGLQQSRKYFKKRLKNI